MMCQWINCFLICVHKSTAHTFYVMCHTMGCCDQGTPQRSGIHTGFFFFFFWGGGGGGGFVWTTTRGIPPTKRNIFNSGSFCSNWLNTKTPTYVKLF